MPLSTILNRLDAKKLFLVDSLGALVSALMLGLVLTSFETSFGMPKNILYVLAALACLFSVYSMVCFLANIKNRGPYLKFIAIVNLLYCALTLALVIYFFQQLTPLGVAYFLLEIIIVVTLAIIEWRTAD